MSLKLGEHSRFVCQWPMAGKTPIIDTGIPWEGDHRSSHREHALAFEKGGCLYREPIMRVSWFVVLGDIVVVMRGIMTSRR